MDQIDEVALQIEVVGPRLGMAFWTDPVEGVAVQETFTRAFPTLGELQQFFLLVKDGAEAAVAVLGVVKLLKEMIRKRPDLKGSMRIRVRMGARIVDSDVAKIRELGCEIEFVREAADRFEGGAPMPPRYRPSIEDDSPGKGAN
ncbi:hypothetical protein [Cupriavidus pauculus]|uniref:hypothetical protein n=1 Tax=Cupriavidus pauculus TaxID=82633 RepID=UPI0038579060